MRPHYSNDPMSSPQQFDLFAPTPEHALLADTLEAFVAREVEPQAAEHDRDETFNHALFRRAGELLVFLGLAAMRPSRAAAPNSVWPRRTAAGPSTRCCSLTGGLPSGRRRNPAPALTR